MTYENLPTTSSRPVPPLALVALLLLIALHGVGCSRDADESARQDAADPAVTAADDLRIITLSPGLSQMLVDLGLGERIVGVTTHDTAAPASLPVVGDYADVSIERLIELSPTHVLALVTAREPQRRLRDLADDGWFELVAYRYPMSVDDVRRILHRHDDDPADRPAPLGELLGMEQEATALSRDVHNRLEALREATAARLGEDEPPRVLIVFGLTPIMASGPGTVHDELLGYLSARNAAERSRVAAPTFDREAMLTLAPDVILLVMPNAPPLREDDPRLAALRGLPVPAVEQGRIHLIDHPLALLESTALPEVAEAMAEAIYER